MTCPPPAAFDFCRLQFPMRKCSRCRVECGLAGSNFKGNGERRPECRACTKKASLAYRRKNRKWLAARSRKFRRENPERVKVYESRRDPKERRERNLRYYQKNRAAKIKYAKARYWANRGGVLHARKVLQSKYPSHVKAQKKVNQLKRDSALGKATKKQIEARVAFYGNRCAYCGGPYEHLDHVIPLAKGGTKFPANLRPACARCNLGKGTKSLVELVRR